MVEIPEKRLKIEQLIESREYPGELRPYLGISSIGESCPRKLWYSFRWVNTSQFSARQKRLFARGHREEAIVIADLESIGCSIHSTQKEVTTGWGHIKGHSDGIVENVPDAPKTPHLLEIKTAGDKHFTKLVKLGSVEQASPGHYGQCQGYMNLLKLKRALYISVNKNNDARYYERIHYNPKNAESLLDRAHDIVSTEVPPGKIGGSSWYECKFCQHYYVCHFNESVNQNCRTCRHLDMHDRGQWACALKSEWRTTAEQLAGCEAWALWEYLK